MSNIYESMFRSIYRVVRAANGPGERHEYTAALSLSLCWIMNIGGVFAIYRRWSGTDLISGASKIELLFFCLAIFLVHYFLLIRGREEASFASRDGSRWAGPFALAYVVGSVAFFLLSV